MDIFLIIILTFLTYIQSLKNSLISDDITANAQYRSQNYPIFWQHIKSSPGSLADSLLWHLFKGNAFKHHLFGLFLFAMLTVSFYWVGKVYLPQKIIFLAALFFTVHPCNAQIAGWISGRWYAIASIIALWALYFNQPILYFVSLIFACNTVFLPLFMNVSIPVKIISILLGLFFLVKMLQSKSNTVKTEGFYKKDNLKAYPRKLIVALKSFSYYFCLALIPVRMGWFHEIGEPIDDKIKSLNPHFWLCLLLLGTMCLYIGKPAFLGLAIFAVCISPFSNILTLGLFTSERYMTLAMMGFSIFLAYLTVNYPYIAIIILTIYFMRTQLELWAYRDDWTLALYSLLNFSRSGFAWSNIANYFLMSGRPFAALDTLKEAVNRCPEFPTIYYQLYFMHRAQNLLNDNEKGLLYLEKACHYGKHENWFKELEDYKKIIKDERIRKFKESYAPRYTTVRQFRPSSQPITSDNQQECLCNFA